LSIARPTLLFFAKNPHNVVVYERVLHRLFSDARVNVSLTSKNDQFSPANAIFDSFDLPRTARIHHRIAALRKFDIYLSPDMFLLCRRAKYKIHTFHGISIKGKAFSEKALAFDRLFLIGPYQRRRFVELGITKEDDPRFVNIGMPKTDAFFDGSMNRDTYLVARRLDPRRKTILYAPTWRPEASLYTIGEDLIRSMHNSPYNFMIKLHDLSYESAGNKIDWKKRLRELAAPNVSVIEELDATPALHATDLLISDASSVANEFALLDRPIVFIDVPALFKKYEKTIDLEGWGQKAGPVARDVSEVHQCIERSFADPAEFAPMRRQIAGEGFYNRGAATAAALRGIYRLLEIDSSD